MTFRTPLPLGALVSLGALFWSGCSAASSIPISDRQTVFVALGASDAVGIGASDPSRTGWVPIVYRSMPASTRLVNLGISGARIGLAVEQLLPVAVDADPDVVAIWLSVNDILGGTPLGDYERDLDYLLAELGRTRARIYVANVPDLLKLPASGAARSVARAEIDEWNSAIASIAKRNGAFLVDLMADGRDIADNREYVAADGFHPNDAGYRRLAEAFWSAMQER